MRCFRKSCGNHQVLKQVTNHEPGLKLISGPVAEAAEPHARRMRASRSSIRCCSRSRTNCRRQAGSRARSRSNLARSWGSSGVGSDCWRPRQANSEAPMESGRRIRKLWCIVAPCSLSLSQNGTELFFLFGSRPSEAAQKPPSSSSCPNGCSELCILRTQPLFAEH